MPNVSKPMLTASYLLRLKPEEKRRLEQLARERDVTLAYALREGAKLYLRDVAGSDVGAGRLDVG